jgi:hypothetical protein
MVTIQIKENSKQAKKFLEYVRTLPFVEFLSPSKSPYDEEFVKEIKRREKNIKGKKLTRINPDNVWENIL